MEFEIEKKGYSKEQVQAYLARREQELRRTIDDQLDRIRALREENDLLNAKLDEFYKRERLIGNALIAAVAKAEEIEQEARNSYASELSSLKAFHAKWLEYYERILKKYPLDDTLKRADKINKDIARMLEHFHAEPPAQSASEVGEIVRKTAEKSVPLTRPQAKDALRPEVRAQYEDESIRLGGGINMNAVSEALSASLEEDDRYEAIAQKWTADVAPKPVVDYLNAQVDARTGVNPAALNTPSDSGFSFEEALHPTEDLGDLVKDLGIEIPAPPAKKGKKK